MASNHTIACAFIFDLRLHSYYISPYIVMQAFYSNWRQRQRIRCLGVWPYTLASSQRACWYARRTSKYHSSICTTPARTQYWNPFVRQGNRRGALHVLSEGGGRTKASRSGDVGHAEEGSQSAVARSGQRWAANAWQFCLVLTYSFLIGRQIRPILGGQPSPDGTERRPRWLQAHSHSMLQWGTIDMIILIIIHAHKHMHTCTQAVVFCLSCYNLNASNYRVRVFKVKSAPFFGRHTAKLTNRQRIPPGLRPDVRIIGARTTQKPAWRLCCPL